MRVERTDLSGVLLIEPQYFAGERGFFLESFHAERYRQHGIADVFVQDNHSRSRQGVLRGLHFQATTVLDRRRDAWPGLWRRGVPASR
ncbi:MAG: dTDP-4-dehydrorhamnose 3,5-epimerase family protein [Xanthobacteraceae bacterium]|jgi:dTDP-4-dehydrorhamnose 3,5-epimerase